MKRDIILSLFMQFGVFAFLISLLIFSPPCFAWPAIVSRVTDGDTIVGKTRDNTNVRIRLYGIDCPELDQPYGKDAQAFLESFLLGAHVVIEELEPDHYGRVVAVVYLVETQKSIQELLLVEGLAWIYPKYCTRAECLSWLEQQNTAQRLRKGLWSSSSRVPPWIWRKQKKNRATKKRPRVQGAGLF